ncbi:hypothetical protein MKY59_20875 [Paenibacillus sp. FSL W8-0426]
MSEQRLDELCEFFEGFERRMLQQGRMLIALHARGQRDKYRRRLNGHW